jgi:hypothetical protein
MDKNTFYNMLTSVIDPKTIKTDDDKKQISFKIPFHMSNVAELKKMILAIFCNPHIADHDVEPDPLHLSYKFDSHYVEIDEDTIKVDKFGRLYVDVSKIGIDQIDIPILAETILSNLKEQYKDNEIVKTAIELFNIIKVDPKTAKIITRIKNDPTLISKLLDQFHYSLLLLSGPGPHNHHDPHHEHD